MKIERSKNAKNNIFFGVILKIYSIIMPFVIRTVIIYYMGSIYLGLNSLFTSILQILNLVELGVGSAMVYAMYKPIVDDDSIKICKLLNLYRRYYRYIGLVVLILGLSLMPFLRYIIHGDIPNDVNIYVLYCMNLSISVLSYWLFAYKTSLFQAHQKTDIISKITIISYTFMYTFQIIFIILIKNYYAFVIINLISQVIINLLTAIWAKKKYPNYFPEGELSNEEKRDINKRIRDLLTSKIGGVILLSADSIVISAFLGLEILAIYQNYFYVITALTGIFDIIFTSIISGIGNSLVVESNEKNYNDLKKFTFLLNWLCTICACCLINCYQPFIEIWVGTDMLLSFDIVIYLSVYFYFFEMNRLLNVFKDAAGIWHVDRFRPLVTSLINLGLNLLLVNFLQLNGVVLSTVIATVLIGIPWIIHSLFSTIFEKKYMKNYFFTLVLYTFTCVLITVGCYFACRYINLNIYLRITLNFIISLFVPNILLLIFYYRSSIFKTSFLFIDSVTNGKLKISKILRL